MKFCRRCCTVQCRVVAMSEPTGRCFFRAHVNRKQLAFVLTPSSAVVLHAELQACRHCQLEKCICCMTHLLLYMDMSACLAATFKMLQVIGVGQPCHRRLCIMLPVACMTWFAKQLVTYSRSALNHRRLFCWLKLGSAAICRCICTAGGAAEAGEATGVPGLS